LNATLEERRLVPLGDVYPGIDPARLAPIGRTLMTTAYVSGVYGAAVGEKYDRLRRSFIASANTLSQEPAAE
jgi:hypothetical protein